MKNINYLLSAYFHQDWRSDAKSADEIIIYFKNTETSKTIESLKSELNSFLLNDEELNQSYIYKNGGNYNPNLDGLSVREWFKRILQLLS